LKQQRKKLQGLLFLDGTDFLYNCPTAVLNLKEASEIQGLSDDSVEVDTNILIFEKK